MKTPNGNKKTVLRLLAAFAVALGLLLCQGCVNQYKSNNVVDADNVKKLIDAIPKGNAVVKNETAVANNGVPASTITGTTTKSEQAVALEVVNRAFTTAEHVAVAKAGSALALEQANANYYANASNGVYMVGPVENQFGTGAWSGGNRSDNRGNGSNGFVYTGAWRK